MKQDEFSEMSLKERLNHMPWWLKVSMVVMAPFAMIKLLPIACLGILIVVVKLFGTKFQPDE